MIVMVWNALVYIFSLWLLGIAFWKSAALTVLAVGCAIVGYGRQSVYRVGFALMIVAALVALDILPPPDHWGTALNHIITPRS
jgi:hypothetical protein